MKKPTRRACLAMLGALALGGVPAASALGQGACGCGTGGRVLAFGDSITFGAEASNFATTAYVPLIAATLGVGYTNYGIPSATLLGGLTPFGPRDSILNEMLGVSPPSKYEPCVMLLGMNDQIDWSTDPAPVVTFQAGLEQGLLWLTSRRRPPEARSARERLLLRQGKLPLVDDGATVYVGNCISEPSGHYLPNGSPAAQAMYNVAIAAAVTNVAAQGRRVHLVDANAAYNPATMDSGDNVHPNDLGHAAIAAAFLAAMHI